jgi:hypothetical protein
MKAFIKEIIYRLLLILICANYNLCYAQKCNIIKGNILDEYKHPVAYATVILQAQNKSYQCSIFTDSVGCFSFCNVPNRSYLLIITHIAYSSDTIKVNSCGTLAPIVLTEKGKLLKNVFVTGERPIMKYDHNKLVYDASALAKNKIVLNAYDILKTVPGVLEINNNLSLAGSVVNVIIDGQNSSLTLEQTEKMLKGLSSDKIDKIEVMYNAPAKYNIKGALINIKLKKNLQQNEKFTSELGLGYTQSFYPSSNQRYNFSYSKKKLSIDFMGENNSGKEWGKNVSYTKQLLNGNMDGIDEIDNYRSNNCNIHSRVGINYSIDSLKAVIFSYYLAYKKENDNTYSDASYKTATDSYSVNGVNRYKDKNLLQDINLQYTDNKFEVGAEYLAYRDSTKDYYDNIISNAVSYLYNPSLQDVDKYSFFIHHGFNATLRLSFSYGVNSGYNYSKTNVSYFDKSDGNYVEDEQERIHGIQKEYSANSYIGCDYNIGNKFSSSVAAKIEYFNSEYNNNGNKEALWDGWNIYPTVTISYSPVVENNFQFDFSTDKSYPSYWAVNPQTTNLSSYTSIEGNSELKPSKDYSGKLVYTYKNKYVFTYFVNYADNYFVQIPHVSDDQLKLIYRYENFDYKAQMGITATIPFKIKDVYSGDITLHGMRAFEQMKHFYNSSFSNDYYYGTVYFNNSVRIRPKLLLEISGMYSSPTYQGISRLGEIWSLDSSLKLDLRKNMFITFGYNNILRHQMFKPIKIDYPYLQRWSKDYERRAVAVSFIWRFGGYKKRHNFPMENQRLQK